MVVECPSCGWKGDELTVIANYYSCPSCGDSLDIKRYRPKPPVWVRKQGLFQCKICGYRGRTWSQVFSHIMREHPEIPVGKVREQIQYLG